MGYAQRHPGVIKGMIMMNCTLNIREGGTPAILKACEFLGVTDTRPYLDESIPLPDRMSKANGELRRKDLWWKMGYASHKSIEMMNKSFEEIPFNHEFENLSIPPEYLEDFKHLTPEMGMPVLFFYGKTDWMVGPEHYKGVEFPEMILWGSNVGHVPFMENKEDLEKAIITYVNKYDESVK